MSDTLRLPRFSEDQDAATIVKWHKKEGDAIKKGEILLEIETDKSIFELEAEKDGIIEEIRVSEGEIKVGEVLAILKDRGNGENEMVKTKNAFAIRLPQLSDAMEEAHALYWRVKVGDVVKKGDILVEVETDKAIIEIDASHKGTVLYQYPENKKKIKVGTIILIIGDEGASVQKLLKESNDTNHG